MILCIDVGNTSIVVGIYKDFILDKKFIINSYKEKAGDEYLKIFMDQFLMNSINYNEIKDVIISSVVPQISEKLQYIFKKLIKKDPIFINQSLKSKLAIKIDNPSELGNDLLVDCVSSNKKYGFPAIVVDVGTATKILVVNDKGHYVGGIIMPGIRIQLRSLVDNASLLSDVNLYIPKNVVGKNTRDSINSGILYGQILAIRSFVEQIKVENNMDYKLILTGGDSTLIKGYLNEFIYDENLLLDGLLYLYRLNFVGDNQ